MLFHWLIDNKNKFVYVTPKKMFYLLENHEKMFPVQSYTPPHSRNQMVAPSSPHISVSYLAIIHDQNAQMGLGSQSRIWDNVSDGHWWPKCMKFGTVWHCAWMRHMFGSPWWVDEVSPQATISSPGRRGETVFDEKMDPTGSKVLENKESKDLRTIKKGVNKIENSSKKLPDFFKWHPAEKYYQL